MESLLYPSRELIFLRPFNTSADVSTSSSSAGSTPQEPRVHPRKRAPNSKSRTGCRTCKTRHVKCDERRPSCDRCKRIGEKCPGYPPLFTSFTHNEIRFRDLAPQALPQHAAAKQPCRRCLRTVGCHCNTFILSSRGGSAKRPRILAPVPASSNVPEKPMEIAVPRHIGVGFSVSRLSSVDTHSTRQTQYRPSQLTNRRPSFTLFSNANEQRYFDYYCNVIGKQLSGWAASRVWDFIVLQASHEELFVRHALVAIAALGKTFEMSQNTKLLTGEPQNAHGKAMAQHQVFAFNQYGKAIRLMREAIAGKKGNIRGALLACLLIVCFETFQGSNDRVQTQIANGVQLLHEWQSKQNKAVEDVSRLGSPAPNVVEDVIYFAFCRLDIKTMISFDGKPADYHLNMALEDVPAIQGMPTAFSDVTQAEGYLSIITRRALHVVNAASPLCNVDSQTMNASTESYADKIFLSSADKINLFFRIFEPESTTPVYQDDENRVLAAVIDPSLAELESWISAFDPVFSKLQSTADPSGAMTSDHIVAMLLQIFARGFIVRVAGGKCTRETFYDRFDHYFDQINSFAESVLRSDAVSTSDPNACSSLQMVTMFDDAVVLPLLSVASKCRNRVIRRKGLRLLWDYPRIENTWDSRLAAMIGTCMMRTEEEGMLEGETYIPEARRVRLATVVRNAARQTRPCAVVKLKRGTQFMLMLIVKV